MKQTIAKHDWLAVQGCLGMAWYRLRTERETPTEAELFRMLQGQEVGVLARGLFPDGVLVMRSDAKSTAQITRDYCADLSVMTMFEAEVRIGPFIAKADILQRDGAKWHIIEVKSSFSDTKSLSELIDDLAYTVMVFRRAGFAVSRASLALLSRTYRFGDPPDKLFEFLLKTDEINQRVTEFDSQADEVARVLFDPTQPAPRLVSACRSCPAYIGKCLGSDISHTVLEIPRLHHTRLKRLSQEGVVDVTQLPPDLPLNPNQSRAVKSMISGQPVVEDGLALRLSKLTWPCHYLDFETVATVLPLYPSHGCHRQTLTQFSIHHRTTMKDVPTHSEYLADPAHDCEGELARRLIEALGNTGSVIVYTKFEEKRIEALRDQFPELKAPLDAILGRLADLEAMIEQNIYHPEFHGSFSIKKVLPALVPELSYAGLEIKNGDMAIARFAKMAKGQILGNDVEATRKQLLEYCKMDTLAMVKLHETLCALAGGHLTKVPAG